MDNEILVSEFKMTYELFGIISSWLIARDMDTSELNNLPKLGLICRYKNHPVAIGFIRRCEGGSGMVDSMIADPYLSNEIRSNCIDKLTYELIQTAKQHEMIGIFAFTLNKNTIKRAKKFGFERTPHVLLSLNLREPRER